MDALLFSLLLDGLWLVSRDRSRVFVPSRLILGGRALECWSEGECVRLNSRLLIRGLVERRWRVKVPG